MLISSLESRGDAAALDSSLDSSIAHLVIKVIKKARATKRVIYILIKKVIYIFIN
jgi:hypothetical protein